MKFKIDENLPAEHASILRGAGFEAETVFDEKLSGTDDLALSQHCRTEGQVLMTLDLDFANVQAYPPKSHSGIVVFRSKSQDKRTLVGGPLYPAYVRGQAYLLSHQGSEAAAEFQKFLDHRGIVMNCPLGALAHLGLARAHALQSDAAKARTTYQDFLALWKDADPDIPILRSAKAEYARLK